MAVTIFNQELVLFFIFFISLINSSLTIIFTSNTVLSVFALIIFFLNLSALLILFELDFLALIFIIIYVGAIAVLFLFIIMLLDLKITYYTISLWRELYFAFLFLIPVSFLILLLINLSFDFTLVNQIIYKFIFLPIFNTQFDYNLLLFSNLISNFTNIESFGLVLYTYNFLLFLFASFVLLVALVGSITLSLIYNISIKYQTFMKQINQKAIYSN